MRGSAILVLLAALAAASLPPTQAAPTTFQASGSFLVGEALPLLHSPGNPGVALTACDAGASGLNDVYSSCRSLQGFALDGANATVTIGGTTAPMVEGVQVCFYSAPGAVIDCPPDLACAGAAWCAQVPAGSRAFAVTSATGVLVQWTFTAG